MRSALWLLAIWATLTSGSTQVRAAVLYGQTQLGKTYDLMADAGAGSGFYGVHPFWSGSGPLFPGSGGLELPGEPHWLRVKRISGLSCGSFYNDFSRGSHVVVAADDGSSLAQSPAFQSGEEVGEYCDLPLVPNAGAADKRFWAIYVCTDSGCDIDNGTMVLDGSGSNNGYLLDGSQTLWEEGGWAFQLCDSGGCSGGFDTSEPCVVGLGNPASCTESALDACLPGGGAFSGAVTFNCGGAATITITDTLSISEDTAIDGGGEVTISGGDSVRVFAVNSGRSFTVENLTIANANSLNGAGIFNDHGNVTVTNSFIYGNSASAGAGGGIFNAGSLAVTNSTFSGNSAYSQGGGIINDGTLTVTDSTFSGNSSRFESGGGISNFGTLTVRNSTFSDNSAVGGAGGGGGIVNYGNLTATNSTFFGNSGTYGGGVFSGPVAADAIGSGTLTNCTFSGNLATDNGGGAIGTYSGSGSISIANTIIANSAGGGNCANLGGSIVDGGHNIDDSATCGFRGPGCFFALGSSRCNTNPRLDLAGMIDNGGPTETIALCTGPAQPNAGCVITSPAIDAGDQAVCSSLAVGNLDQRGFLRPGLGASKCSIGAFEPRAVVAPSPIVYAALGDSYSSGEGVGFYLPGTAAGLFGNGCHRSEFAYPRRLALPGRGGKTLFELSDGKAPGYGMSFVACSGATSPAITPVDPPNSWEEEFSFKGEPVQAVATSISSDADLVTLTVGGNDVGFAEVLQHCVDTDDCHDKPPPEELYAGPPMSLDAFLRASIQYRIEEWTQRLLEIRTRFPRASVFLLGYPRLVSGEPCSATRACAIGTCLVGAGGELDEEEQASIRRWADVLNEALKQAAAGAGVHFVPVAEHFSENEVCSAKEDWIHGISEFDYLTGIKCQECFHPKLKGQQAYAQAFSDHNQRLREKPWTPGFTDAGLPRNPSPVSDSQTVVRGTANEAFGRLGSLEVTATERADCAELSTIAPGAGAHLHGEGFDASSEVSIRIIDHGVDILELPGATDAGGMLDVDVEIPIDLPVPALVRFQVSGVSPEGTPLVLLGLRLTTPPMEEAPDTDGDGYSDICDLCPNLLDDQADTDGDGKGDACDSCVSDPENDFDGDGICAPDDHCPLDPLNDEDGDGVCAEVDGCPWVYDPAQQDPLYDGSNDACSLICGSPVKHSAVPIASDCLFVLRTAVGQTNCAPECICDTNGDKFVKASDALMCLRRAIGSLPSLSCGC